MNRPTRPRCPEASEPGGRAASTPAPLTGPLTSIACLADDRPDCQRAHREDLGPPTRPAGAGHPFGGEAPAACLLLTPRSRLRFDEPQDTSSAFGKPSVVISSRLASLLSSPA